MDSSSVNERRTNFDFDCPILAPGILVHFRIMISLHTPPRVLIASVLALAGSTAISAQPPAPESGSPFAPELKEFVENFKPNTRATAYTQRAALSPAESLSRLDPAPGFKVELAAHEPDVRQPLDLQFDHRGRLWVVQYIQFPFPAGLKVVGYDGNLRAKYDRVPPPPPNHFRGADKITIHEDTNGDGVYDKHKIFVTGLNMATSLALDHDGVWAIMMPYLLFYPDRNHDDVPDGDPEIHLAGFNFEDTHSPATSLHWGPDGWLYGAKGSTSTLDIQGIRLLGQGIWRYHPKTGKFEIFAEGGGNTVSLDFDRYGRAFSGTNNANTRGPHYVQGATYNKSWPKHGPALNPFIFGFFPHMEHEGYAARFAQAFVIYEGGLLPALDGHVIAGMAITSRVQPSRLVPDTSTFRTIDLDPLITSRDLAFRPVDVETGPDGCLYIADWTDVRISHLNPHDTWDKTNGRIFRVVPANFPRPAAIDLGHLPPTELLKLLTASNRWYREEARRLLAVSPEPIESALKALVSANSDGALEAFWTLNLRGALDTALSLEGLRHPNEHIRRWTVRLLGDRNVVNELQAAALANLAKSEPNVEVRSQLASSARRLPAPHALPVIRQLIAREGDEKDKHMPLLIWWAIESKADSAREEVLAMLKDPAVWKTKMFAQHIAERIGRRYTADQGPRKYYTLTHNYYTPWQIDRSSEFLYRNLETLQQILALAPDEKSVDTVLAGAAEGLVGDRVAAVPPALRQTIARVWASRPPSAGLATLAARLGNPAAMTATIDLLRHGDLSVADERRLIDFLASTATSEALPLIGALLKKEKNDAKLERLMTALSKYPGADAAALLIDAVPGLPLRLRIVANNMLSAKPAWARVMLQRAAAGTFKPGAFSKANEKVILDHNDPEITRLFTEYQRSRLDHPDERLALQLFDKGKIVYSQLCGVCHQPDGKGQPQVSPALVGSRWLQHGEDALVRIVLQGKENGGRNLVMPPLKHLDDEQIASVLVYVLREFGNKSDLVQPRKVAAIRAATADRPKAWTDSELEALLGRKGAGSTVARDQRGGIRTISIEATRTIRFTVQRIDMRANERVRVLLRNSSEIAKERMAHNFVLLKKGTDPMEFVTAAAKARDSDYLPPALKDRVIIATKLLGPGENDSVVLENLEPGEYVYVATFPGHYAIGMHGVLAVN
jgi:putative membrane-bound dehydrogenase-like protein